MQYLLNAMTVILCVGCCMNDQSSQSLFNTILLQRQITDKDFKSINDLHLAVEEGNLNAVRRCLESGADINCVQGKASSRVLHKAANAGNKSMVKLLIQKQASVTARAMNGWTPLDIANKKGHLEVVQFLRENGAKTNEELKVEGK